MLTADLVRLRKKGDHHVLEGLGDETRRALLEMAARIVDVGLASVGRTRGELELLRAAEGESQREKLFAKGLAVVFDDASTFEGGGGEATVGRRLALFEYAARRRKEDAAGDVFERTEIMASFARAQGLDTESIDRDLYADRKREERLVAAGFSTGEALLARWELGRVQAFLLRSTAITIELGHPEPNALRKLLRALKFQQLLHVVEVNAGAGAVIRIDGASSLFDPTTKYGLRYALLVPAMIVAGATRIVADLKLRPKRSFLVDDVTLRELSDEATRLTGEVPARAEVDDLLERFPALASRWTAARSTRLIDLVGVTVCVPDLEFVRDDGLRIAFELLGYWNRSAAWARVEAVEKGLSEPVLFAVSERLRVSREALPKEAPSALYVFKGTLRPKLVLDHLERLAEVCDARQRVTIETPKARAPRKRP